MVSDRIFSYSGRFLIFPVPAFTFCDLDSTAGAFASEDCSKNFQYFSLFCIPRNPVSHFLSDRTCIFPSLSLTTNVPMEAFLVALVIHDLL